MKRPNITQRLQLKAIKVRVWLWASVILTGVCGVFLPLFFSYLYAARPHITDVSRGFILPHYKDGISYYFAHSDEALIRIFALGLMLGLIALILSSVYALRRPLMRKLQPPEDEAAPPDQDEAGPSAS
ncbi:MAG: hypothetical protein WBQ60_03160 [Asticcacaulis sp.]